MGIRKVVERGVERGWRIERQQKEGSRDCRGEQGPRQQPSRRGAPEKLPHPSQQVFPRRERQEVNRCEDDQRGPRFQPAREPQPESQMRQDHEPDGYGNDHRLPSTVQ